MLIIYKMAEGTVYAIAIGFFLGGALKDFFQAVTQDLVAPFAVLLGGVEKSVEGVTVSIGPVKLEIGKAIGAALTLLTAILVVSITLPYVRAYAPSIGAARR
jgi:large-conductance mechanosensitive channel